MFKHVPIHSIFTVQETQRYRYRGCLVYHRLQETNKELHAVEGPCRRFMWEVIQKQVLTLRSWAAEVFLEEVVLGLSFAGWEKFASWKHLHSATHLDMTTVSPPASGLFLRVYDDTYLCTFQKFCKLPSCIKMPPIGFLVTVGWFSVFVRFL